MAGSVKKRKNGLESGLKNNKIHLSTKYYSNSLNHIKNKSIKRICKEKDEGTFYSAFLSL